MNKKVLALTLVLVMAFASSAMASITFTGKFTATAEMDSLKVFKDGYKLTPKLEISIKGDGSNETDEATNWDFTAELGANDGFKLGKYKLGLYDQYFTGYAWGNGQELTDKNTHFSMISAPKKAAAGTMRARLEVPVMDLADVTIDFEAEDNIRAFVDAEVEGFDIGLAYARKGWTEDAANVVVGQVGTAIPAGDLDVNVKAAAGLDLGENLGLAFGFGVDAQVIEDVKVEGSVTHANSHWLNGDALTADNTVLSGKVTYEEAAIQAILSGSQTLVKDDKDANSNEITIDAKYRMSDTLAYNHLFHKDHWFKNTAPAFGVGAEFVDFGFGSVYVNASAPVVEGMVWVKGNAEFENKNKYNAGVDGYIQATDKLVVKPAASYAKPGDVVDLKLVADYKIGLSDTLLTLTVQKVMTEDGYMVDDALVAKELLKAAITVPF